MTPEELKKSIFIYAFTGKLVEQNNDEKVFSSSFKDVKEVCDDIEIPATWRWTYLPDIANILYGFPFNSEFFNDTKQGRPLIRIRDIIGGKTNTYTTENCPNEYIIKKGDLLVGMDGNFQVEYWNSEDALLNQRVCKITAKKEHLNQDYLYYYLPIILKEVNGSVSFSTVKHLSAKILKLMLVPLPPLAEQHRIVAKIEELLPFVDRYAEAYDRLEEFNAKFPEEMKKSVLQYAIEGRLVEQRAEEGTAEELYRQIQSEKQKLIKEGKIKKEKPLPEISEDEIPFDIPESWKWVRVGDLFNHNPGKAMNSSVKNIDKSGSIRKFITTSNVYWNRFDFTNVKEMFFSDDELERFTAKKGDLLICEGGAYYGRTAIWNYDYEICFQNHVHRLRQYADLDQLFFYYVFYFYRNTNLIKSKGTAMPGLSSVVLHGLVVPLPPLAEQRRIVARIEELLPLCERLAECREKA